MDIGHWTLDIGHWTLDIEQCHQYGMRMKYNGIKSNGMEWDGKVLIRKSILI